MRSLFHGPRGISTFVAARLRVARTGVDWTGRKPAGAALGTGTGARNARRSGIAMGRRLTSSGSTAMRGAGRETAGTGGRKSGRAAGTASGRRLANPVSAGTRGIATTSAGMFGTVLMRLAGTRAKSWGANRADGSGRRFTKRSIGCAGARTSGPVPRAPGGTGGWSGFSHGRGDPDTTGS